MEKYIKTPQKQNRKRKLLVFVSGLIVSFLIFPHFLINNTDFQEYMKMLHTTSAKNTNVSASVAPKYDFQKDIKRIRVKLKSANLLGEETEKLEQKMIKLETIFAKLKEESDKKDEETTLKNAKELFEMVLVDTEEDIPINALLGKKMKILLYKMKNILRNGKKLLIIYPDNEKLLMAFKQINKYFHESKTAFFKEKNIEKATSALNEIILLNLPDIIDELSSNQTSLENLLIKIHENTNSLRRLSVLSKIDKEYQKEITRLLKKLVSIENRLEKAINEKNNRIIERTISEYIEINIESRLPELTNAINALKKIHDKKDQLEKILTESSILLSKNSGESNKNQNSLVYELESIISQINDAHQNKLYDVLNDLLSNVDVKEWEEKLEYRD